MQKNIIKICKQFYYIDINASPRLFGPFPTKEVAEQLFDAYNAILNGIEYIPANNDFANILGKAGFHDDFCIDQDAIHDMNNEIKDKEAKWRQLLNTRKNISKTLNVDSNPNFDIAFAAKMQIIPFMIDYLKKSKAKGSWH